MNENFLFQKFVTTTFVKKKLSLILINLVASVIRIHLGILIGWIIQYNPYTDFFIQIAITICIALQSGIIYNFLGRFEHEFYLFTRYLINNWSPENYRFWKRCFMVGICLYAWVCLAIIKVNNIILELHVLQYFISHVIID